MASPHPRPILIAPHPALRRRARPVADAEMAAARALLPEMFGTMYAAPGIGLAAPQIGVEWRMMVVDVADKEEEPRPLAFINPEILRASDETSTHEEGCLSLPGQYADITRPARVALRYLDETGAAQEMEAEGMLATCIQHEIDHLDGILFVDHLSPLKRNMLMRKLAKSRRGKE